MNLENLLLDAAKFLASATGSSFIKRYFTKWGQEKYSQRQQTTEQEEQKQNEVLYQKIIDDVVFVACLPLIVYSGLVLVNEIDNSKRRIPSGTSAMI